MRSAFIVILALALLFAGCVAPPAPTGPSVVNVTQTAPAGGQAQPSAPSAPAQVTVNQTTQGQTVGAAQGLSAIASREVSFTTSDGWKIYGTLYPAKNSKPTIGVVLIPQKGADRSSFGPLVPALHDALPDADIMAIDTRGSGKSTNLGTSAGFLAGDYRAMSNDVKGATDYFSFYRFISGYYYLVGSSIGSSVAIDYAAQDSGVQKVVMISPGLDYEGVDIKPALTSVRKKVFIVASDADPQSSTDSTTIYSLSNAPVKQLFLYKTVGPAHGTDLFAATEASGEGKLTQKIADWLQSS